jgi:death-on-curing protein
LGRRRRHSPGTDSKVWGHAWHSAYKSKVTTPKLAAALAWGLLRNHPFVDGNKRIALASMVVFLELNGWELMCREAEETAMILRAAAGEVNASAWRDWVVKSAVRRRNG